MFVRKNIRFIEAPPEGDEGAGEQPGADETEGAEADGTTPETEGDSEPDLDGEFDPQRALAKIKKINSENKNLREENKRLKSGQANGAGEQPPADPASSDPEDGPTREDLLAKVARLEVLSEHGVPVKYLKFITATEPDEITAQVTELLELSAPAAPAPNRRPTPNLKGGHNPNVEPEETDPRKLAARIPRM